MATDLTQCPCEKSPPLELAVTSAMGSLWETMKAMIDYLPRYDHDAESKEHLLTRTLPILARAICDLEPLQAEYRCDVPPARDSRKASRK